MLTTFVIYLVGLCTTLSQMFKKKFSNPKKSDFMKGNGSFYLVTCCYKFWDSVREGGRKEVCEHD